MASHSVYLSVVARSSISNMFSRILAIFAVSLLCIHNSESAPAVGKARQFLPALPGYIPVYIRPGDTPLEDINPDLAEAFNSYAFKHARLGFARANSAFDGQIHVAIDSTTAEPKDDTSFEGLDDLDLEEQNAVSPSDKPTLTESQHIQKIPRS